MRFTWIFYRFTGFQTPRTLKITSISKRRLKVVLVVVVVRPSKQEPSPETLATLVP